MKKMFIKPITFILLLASLFSILSFSAFGMEKGDTGSIESFSVQNISTDFTEDDNVKISSRFLELLFKRGEKKEEIRLCPSGEAFGIIINEDGVTVTKAPIDSPLSVGDRIIKIGKNECTECGQVYEAVKNSGGSPLKLTVVRDGKECEISVTPKYKDGEYALGISLRSQSAGLGTITFIDPKTNAFGGLGHSVSDSETGDPVSLKGGVASKVTLGACKKGESGKAGELSGVLGRKSIGTLTSNNECGVFGVLTESSANAEKAIPIAYRDEIKEGEAEIISTIKNGKTATYKNSDNRR